MKRLIALAAILIALPTVNSVQAEEELESAFGFVFGEVYTKEKLMAYRLDYCGNSKTGKLDVCVVRSAPKHLEAIDSYHLFFDTYTGQLRQVSATDNDIYESQCLTLAKNYVSAIEANRGIKMWGGVEGAWSWVKFSGEKPAPLCDRYKGCLRTFIEVKCGRVPDVAKTRLVITYFKQIPVDPKQMELKGDTSGL